MHKTKKLKHSNVAIKSASTYPLSRNDLFNNSFSDDQDKQDFFSDCDIQLDNSDNDQITIEAFQTKVESEVVKILIEIYNSKIGLDQNSLSPSIQRFQSEVEYFTSKYNLQFSVYILQLLAEKLVDLVHRCKIKLDTDILYQNLKTISSIKNQFDIEKAKNFLLGLNSIKQALVRSSKDIADVFKSPIETIKTFTINIEEIIKELFYKEFIQDDEIIFNLISNFKYYDRGIEKKEAKGNCSLSLLEEEKFQSQLYSQNELDKFNEYLRQLETDKFDNEEEEDDELIEKDFNNENEEECKCASLDIDELVQYINTKDSSNTKPKKGKKKNKKKKKEMVETIEAMSSVTYSTSINTNNKATDQKNNDKEIELFKETITKISTCAFTNHKIRPIISKEWLVKIERLMD